MGICTDGASLTTKVRHTVSCVLRANEVFRAAGPILAVACAAADLLDEGHLDVDVLMLLEGEEETVSMKRCEVRTLLTVQ